MIVLKYLMFVLLLLALAIVCGVMLQELCWLWCCVTGDDVCIV